MKIGRVSLLERMYIFLYLKYKRIFKKITERYILILIRKNYKPELYTYNMMSLYRDQQEQYENRTINNELLKLLLFSRLARLSPIPRHYLDPEFFKITTRKVQPRDYLITACSKKEYLPHPNPKFFRSMLPVASFVIIEIDNPKYQ